LGRRRYSIAFIFSLFLGLCMGSILFGAFNQQNNALIANSAENIVKPLESTNPSSPTVLSDDNSLYEYYSSSDYYYYKTGSASPSYYHVVWVQPTDSADDFDLYLYSTSTYSSYQTYSGRGSGYLDWVVFRPSSSQYYYPKVYREVGTGYAYIEWEISSTSLIFNNSYSGALSVSDCIEVYEVSLSTSLIYTFSLDVPTGADYDIYLYSFSAGATNSYGYYSCSTNYGDGIDETILDYIPSYTGDYALLIVRRSGSGTYNLNTLSSPIFFVGLSDDSYKYETYNAAGYYNYRTSTAYSSYYHVVWLQPADISKNCDLYLYSDRDYSDLKASSTRGSGYLDWIVYRPSISQYYYPQVYASESGNAYIEWEDGSYSISIDGSSTSASLSVSESIEVYRVYLYSSTTYNFGLNVPNEADYDLYLYYLSAGNATNYNGFTRCSTNVGTGVDEKITSYKPSSSGDHVLLLVRQSGSGVSYLSVSTFSGSYNTLFDDSAEYEYYSSSSNYYYYQTDIANPSDYYVVWLQPTSTTPYFYLYLYSDDKFSIYETASTQGYGSLNWVVFRPNSSQSYYPKVYRSSGTDYAYIEWEKSNIIAVGDSVYTPLSSSDCVEIYIVNLSSANRYDFKLDVPSGGDFDLYLYHLDTGKSTNIYGYERGSYHSEYGQNEFISNFHPDYSDNFALVVVRSGGTGIFTLSVNYHEGMGALGICLIILGIVSVIGLSAAVYKKYNRERAGPNRQPTPPQNVRPQSAIGIQSREYTSIINPPLKVIKPPSNFIFCPYCGTKNGKNLIFCTTCGSDLEAN